MPIQEKDLLNARIAWGDGLIKISKTFETKGIEEATSVAGNMIDKLYFYDFGEVLFKPTLSGGSQTFRPTKGKRNPTKLRHCHSMAAAVSSNDRKSLRKVRNLPRQAPGKPKRVLNE